MSKHRLALFDLDNTLLAGDSDVLWCEFLMAKGVIEREAFARRNADMERRYREGSVGTKEFAHFYLGLLAGKTPAHWEPLRQEFLVSQVVPRIPPAAVALVDKHIDAGDLVIMTTATSRFITELTAVYFGIEHLLAIEPEIADGVFTGASTGILNMRSGKVERLHEWLTSHSHDFAKFRSTAYSDSINDLPLLEAVNEPVVVDPDPRLSAIAQQRGWQVLSLHARGATTASP
jgi:HAD superfamily hydrolase (TIGR01490 family)